MRTVLLALGVSLFFSAACGEIVVDARSASGSTGGQSAASSSSAQAGTQTVGASVAVAVSSSATAGGMSTSSASIGSGGAGGCNSDADCGSSSCCNGACVDTTQDDKNCGFCSHECAGCSQSQCPTAVVAANIGSLQATDPNSIAVDPGPGGRVYWTVNAPGVPGKVGRVNKDATMQESTHYSDIISTVAPDGIVTDGASVYWYDEQGLVTQVDANDVSYIVQIPAPGGLPDGLAVDSHYVFWVLGGVLFLAPKQSVSEGLVVLAESPYFDAYSGVALTAGANGLADAIFWGGYDNVGKHDAQIASMTGNADGTPLGNPVAGSFVHVSLAVSAKSGKLCFAYYPVSGGSAYVYTSNLDGTGFTSTPVKETDPRSLAFNPKGDRCYWTSQGDHSIRVWPLQAAHAYDLYSSPGATTHALAVDDGFVYFGDGSGSILKIAN